MPSIQHPCFLSSKGSSGSIWLRAINRGGARASLRLSTLGDFVSLIKSAWEPSNSLVLARLQMSSE